MATPNAQAAVARIRQGRHIRKVRFGLMIAGALFALWWIVEFLTYGGRTSAFDAFDFLSLPLAGTIGWLVYQAWRARCPQCGSPFFINPGLPLGFHFSTQCPFCSTSLDDKD